MMMIGDQTERINRIISDILICSQCLGTLRNTVSVPENILKKAMNIFNLGKSIATKPQFVFVVFISLINFV
jgi:hypothetical protein